VASRVAQESPELYYEIQSLNDYGAESLEALSQAVERLRSAVISQDFEAFDFTRGDERFKSRFASSVRQNASFEWIPRRIDRYCWEAARHAGRVLRSWARRVGKDGAGAARQSTQAPKTSNSAQP